MRICDYRDTTKNKLKSLAEDVKIDESLIKHYTFILEHFDEIIASHDVEIAKIDEKKEEVLKHFIAAPEKLIILSEHIAKLQEKTQDIKTIRKDKTHKISRLRSLRERLAALQQECRIEGIDIDNIPEDIV